MIMDIAFHLWRVSIGERSTFVKVWAFDRVKGKPYNPRRRTGKMSRSAAGALSRSFLILMDIAMFAIARHWLILANLAAGLYLGLPILAPYLMHIGHPFPAKIIYTVYSFLCHQLPERSFFFFGYQMAICQRCVAMYGSIFLAGFLFGLLRGGLQPLPWKVYILLNIPVAIDGVMQLVGLWESTWWLRTATGALFGISSVWLFYPYLEGGMREVQASITLSLSHLHLGSGEG